MGEHLHNKYYFDSWLKRTYPDLYHYFFRGENSFNFDKGLYNLCKEFEFNINDTFDYYKIITHIKNNEHLHEFWML